MLEYTALLVASAGTSFFVHDYLDKNYIGRDCRDVKLIIRGYHFHHSFFGVMVMVLGIALSGGYLAVICCGYGLGNVWQHKLTHNRIKERGMVFVSRVYPYKRNIT